jgi:hypothetical protein
MADDQYPEHAKLMAVRDRSQAVGEFLDWLQHEQGYSICEWSERVEEDDEHEYRPAGWVNLHRPIDSWLAQFYQINPVRLEEEKRAMLDAQRALNARVDADKEAAR